MRYTTYTHLSCRRCRRRRRLAILVSFRVCFQYICCASTGFSGTLNDQREKKRRLSFAKENLSLWFIEKKKNNIAAAYPHGQRRYTSRLQDHRINIFLSSLQSRHLCCVTYSIYIGIYCGGAAPGLTMPCRLADAKWMKCVTWIKKWNRNGVFVQFYRMTAVPQRTVNCSVCYMRLSGRTTVRSVRRSERDRAHVVIWQIMSERQ